MALEAAAGQNPASTTASVGSLTKPPGPKSRTTAAISPASSRPAMTPVAAVMAALSRVLERPPPWRRHHSLPAARPSAAGTAETTAAATPSGSPASSASTTAAKATGTAASRA